MWSSTLSTTVATDDGDDQAHDAGPGPSVLPPAEFDAGDMGGVGGGESLRPAVELHAAQAAPPPAPSVAGSVASSRGGPRTAAVATICLRGGKISFYEKGNMVECICHTNGHGKCVLTRRMHGDRRGRATAQGRPLGLASAWLSNGHKCSAKLEHREAGAAWPTLEERRAGRAALKAMAQRGSADAVVLLACERGKRDGEDSELEECP